LFIQTEQTPNPAAIKFIPGCAVMSSGTMDFPSPESAWRSLLVEELFKIPGVGGVFLGSDFITVSKAENAEWMILKPLILGSIMEYFMVHEHAVVKGEDERDQGAISSAEDDDVIKEIKELIETRVRPAVAQDGGNIMFDRFENGVVFLKLQGSCSHCPSATQTLKAGIENMLRHYIPEVQEVRAV
jgi:Fe-S cluster biogenesis protein NfuA